MRSLLDEDLRQEWKFLFNSVKQLLENVNKEEQEQLSELLNKNLARAKA